MLRRLLFGGFGRIAWLLFVGVGILLRVRRTTSCGKGRAIDEPCHHPDKYCILGVNPNLKRFLMNKRLDPSNEASRISIIITKWKYVERK
ncbi:BQ5605_C007g04496 [Microbotryum silenes-dioicae]|uniref:BQ5605_C007g04496 protein n=1 Tax=Microbotryum silenes-dioicae TaxID=796604 RepID=A0A2X0MA52_9BASI|nr:BQ5605_C007g04496 [Microbotryum silenes-dioicae]